MPSTSSSVDFPLQSSRTGSSCGSRVAAWPRAPHAVHASFRVFQWRGIVVLVQRSPLDLRHDGGTLGVFPHPPARRTLKNAVVPLSWTSLCSRVLSRAGPPNLPVAAFPTCVGPSRLARLTTLLRFGASTALETRAATYIGVASPDCAAPSVFLRPLTPYSALRPVSLVPC